MRVCDKHTDRKAVDTIHVLHDDSHIDVCDECKYEILEILSSPVESPKRRGRPPKNQPQPN